MISEDGLIARYLAPLAGQGAHGLMDDAASLAPPPGCELVLTKDMLAAGIHFFADDPPGAVASKALRVNLSDLAAKGARPLGLLLGLALPDGLDEAWIADFAAGLGADVAAYGCPLLGGDTVRASGGLTLSVTAIGAVEAGQMVRRTGARDGDVLAVTGTIGDAALGLGLRLDPGAPWAAALAAAEREELLDRYLLPRPRNAVAHLLAPHRAAGMDISDGLVGDALKLAAAAAHEGRALAPVIELARLPLSPAARAALAADPSLITTIATGGDDYELLLAVPPDRIEALAAAMAPHVPLTVIGCLAAGSAPSILGLDGRPAVLDRTRFEHGWS